jgi:hypothetical protein
MVMFEKEKYINNLIDEIIYITNQVKKLYQANMIHYVCIYDYNKQLESVLDNINDPVG